MLPERAAARPGAGVPALTATMLALVAVLLWSAGHDHLPQFQGKAMHLRFAFVPLAAATVPAGWWLARHVLRRPLDFPFAPAVLVALALLLDLVGNATRLYDTVEYFDDAVHAVNPVLLVSALAIVLCDPALPRWATWVMAFGLGCAGNILWEIAEYAVMTRFGADALALSLPDTLSDQAWGVLGAALGATVPVLLSSMARAEAAVGRPGRARERAAVPSEPSLASTASR